MKILLASPRGFCAGVRRATDVVEVALKRFGAPVYVRKEIVHNKMVVARFRERGVVFIDSLEEAPEGSCVVFSAHGISPAVREDAKNRKLHAIDATCPLVTKVHMEVHRYLRDGYTLILIGHRDHEEVEGTMGEAPGQITLVENVADVERLALPPTERIVVLTQTTLSMEETEHLFQAIKARFPAASRPPKDDICYATQNRQDAVRELIRRGAEVVLVIGSKNSSNSQRLCEVAREGGARSHLIDRAAEIDPAWLQGVGILGLTAGASAPEDLVTEVLAAVGTAPDTTVEEIIIVEEDVVFSLPRELTQEEAFTGHP